MYVYIQDCIKFHRLFQYIISPFLNNIIYIYDISVEMKISKSLEKKKIL